MAKKKMAKATLASSKRKRVNPPDATLRNVRAANIRQANTRDRMQRESHRLSRLVTASNTLERRVTKMEANYLLVLERLAATRHRVDHLALRVTDLDGQVGGGDEDTSRAEAEAAVANQD